MRVTFEAKIVVALDEHFRVDRAVRLVTGRAALAQGLVFKHAWRGLLAVTLGARFVESGHGQTATGFHDVHAVRVVALDAVHFPLKDRMMLWQMKLSVCRNVALETRFGLFAGVDDKLTSADRDVLARRAMTRFATLLACHLRIGQSQARVWARWEHPRDLVVTIGTRLVADIMRTFDLQWRDDRSAIEADAGVEQYNRSRCNYYQEQGNDDAFHRNWALWIRLTRDPIKSIRRGDCLAKRY